MKKIEEIKKGLEICGFMESLGVCEDCPYNQQCQEEYDKKNIPPGSSLMRDAHELIKNVESLINPRVSREWDLLNLLSSAWYGKQCYFQQDDGMIYSRSSGRYLSLDQAIDEFAGILTDESDYFSRI